MQFNTQFVSMQGKFFMGGRAPFEEDLDKDGLVARRGPMVFVGNVSSAVISFRRESVSRKATYTGTRDTIYKQTTLRGGDIELKLDNVANPHNLSAAFQSPALRIASGSATNCPFVTYSPNTKPNFVALRGAALPTVGSLYYVGLLGSDRLYDPVQNINTDTIVVRDSSSTPKTLTKDVNYKVANYRTGGVLILDLTTGGPFVGPLKVNTTYGATVDRLSSNIAPGFVYRLSHPKISDITIRDSSPTPQTIPSTQYEVEETAGYVIFNSTFDESDLVYPLYAIYTAGTSYHFPFLSTPQIQEYSLFFDGIDTAYEGATRRITVDLYRVQWDPVSQFELLNDETASLPLKGEILSDPTMDPDSVMGTLGRYSLL